MKHCVCVQNLCRLNASTYIAFICTLLALNADDSVYFHSLSQHLFKSFIFFCILIQFPVTTCALQHHSITAHLPISSHLPRATYAGTEGPLPPGRRAVRGEQVAPVETTPINHLINHNWPIYIFATYSQLSFSYVNAEQSRGPREEEVEAESEPVGFGKIKLELYSDLCSC